jgi:hypothetical protein
MVYGVWNIVWNCKGTAGFFMETTRNLNLNVEALKYHVMSTILEYEKFWYVRKIFRPLKWYTDRKFLATGGGGRQKKFSPEKFFLH